MTSNSNSGVVTRIVQKIKRVLIANRGEIATRIIKSCKSRGIQTIALYTNEEKDALFVSQASDAIRLKGSAAEMPYLDFRQVLAAARSARADAIHPGYGFLSENSEFADAVRNAGMEFIGPSSSSMAMLGDKLEAKDLAKTLNIPVAPSIIWNGSDSTDLLNWARDTGYPLLIKAAAGGGGRGMRVVSHAAELPSLLSKAAAEAKAFFGDGSLFLEKLIPQARHIEVQIAGDKMGNIATILDRDCSMQRRHQKIIEEAPAPGLSRSLRQSLHHGAIELARASRYFGLGTVEFLVDPEERFYFLEVNCRLQVEHPVTEQVTGIDLVAMQFDIAEGRTLPIKKLAALNPQKCPVAIEVRLCAEDPSSDFRPSIGTLDQFDILRCKGLRVDSGFRRGDVVTPFFDSLLAKIVAVESSREAARKCLVRVLSESSLTGITSNIQFLKALLESDQFAKARHHTHSVAELIQVLAPNQDTTLIAPTLTTVPSESEPPNLDPWSRGDNFGRIGYSSNSRTRSPVAARPGAKAPPPATLSTPFDADISSPLPGKVIALPLAAGTSFLEGETLALIESMKMEHPIRAVHRGKVTSVHQREGSRVDAREVLLKVRYGG